MNSMNAIGQIETSPTHVNRIYDGEISRHRVVIVEINSDRLKIDESDESSDFGAFFVAANPLSVLSKPSDAALGSVAAPAVSE